MTQAPIFYTLNNQSDGKNNLVRMEFYFKGISYRFAVNPEELTQVEPNRANITHTKSGGWIDSFGGGVQTINLKGHTGLKNKGNEGDTGFKKFKELRDIIRNVYFNVEPGVQISDELIFHNYTDGESWVVVPMTFQLLRSISRPLLYQYNISLSCVRPASTPTSGGKSAINLGVAYMGGGK